MRIDSHTHDWLCHKDIKDPEEYMANCAKAGIDGIVLIETPAGKGLSENDFDVVERFGDFIIPVLMIDLDQDNPEKVHRLFDRGALGVKFISPDHSYSDKRYLPFYQAVKDRDGVAVFHTGYLMHTPDYDPTYGSGMDNMRPGHIDAILRQVPHLKVLMAHFGAPYWDECFQVIVSHPTVYTDFSGGSTIMKSMFFWKEMFTLNGKMREDAVAKLCFGTDIGYFREGGEIDPRLPQYLDFYERFFKEINVPANLQEQVNSGNILNLFGRQ